jgi:hypothetical protein
MSTNKPEYISASAVLRMLPFRTTRRWLEKKEKKGEFPAAYRDPYKCLYQKSEVEIWIAKFREGEKPSRPAPERVKRTPERRTPLVRA